MKNTLTIMLSLLVAAISVVVNAANYQGNASGKVVQVLTHLNDWTSTDFNQTVVSHIYISGLPAPNSGTGGCVTSGGVARVSVSNDNPAYNSILATALSAKASNLDVQVIYLDTCSVRSNSWDIGVIYIK